MRLHVTRADRIRAERRARRGIRTAGIAVAAAGLIGASAVAALPAAATTAAPLSVRVVGGDRQITAAWNTVAHATGYTVHWGTGSSTGHTIHTRGTSVRIGGVRDFATYSVRVTADHTASASPRRTARPVPYIPTSITRVRAVPAGPDQIRVTWSGGTQARSFAIIGGSDSITDKNHFSTGWHPAAYQSWTVTIPSRLHDVLGAGSGNAVFLKVVLTNSTATDPVKHYTFNAHDKYRLTPSGTWSFAGAPADHRPVTRVQVASWNVQSITATASFTSKDQWAQRKARVVANIENLHPDLIGLQELTSARLDPTGCHNSPSAGIFRCTEQYQTLQTALSSSAGVAVPYRNAREDAISWLYTQGSNVYVDSALFYNPARLTVVTSGFVSPRTIMGSAWPSSQADEVGMWAEFSTRTTPSRSFLALSIHQPAGSSSAVSQLRKAEAAAVARWIDGKATRPDGTRLPVVFVGDLIANGGSDPNAGSLQLRHLGYIDAGATTNRGGYNYSTSNATNGTDGADDGYPVHAVTHPYPTSRIDYIMIRRSPFTYGYRNEVRLVPGTTRFDPRYQGSDHNLQLANIGIADPS
ncbi:MAG: endonuclease/exonuclease/phosphatase family protein [Amnibacterium sp.]